jgi:hypothetical protein
MEQTLDLLSQPIPIQLNKRISIPFIATHTIKRKRTLSKKQILNLIERKNQQETSTPQNNSLLEIFQIWLASSKRSKGMKRK